MRQMSMNALLFGLVLAQNAQAAPVPEFTMTRWLNAEKSVKLSDYKGKVVVLHVGPGFC
jgi:hypothetical protein